MPGVYGLGSASRAQFPVASRADLVLWDKRLAELGAARARLILAERLM